MDTGARNVRKMVGSFRQRLAGIHSDREIIQFLYLLFEKWMGWPKAEVHLHYDLVPGRREQDLFEDALSRLEKGVPVQYVLGEAAFDGYTLLVDPRVLIPRPETGELCDLVRGDLAGSANASLSILDVGTGSGCIALSMARSFPGASVTGADIDPGALAVAAGNASLSPNPVTFIRADILDPACNSLRGPYHLIISNPPYVPESEREELQRTVVGYEPGHALFVPDDDPVLFYRALASFSAGHLFPGGWLFLEIHERFGSEVVAVVTAAGLTEVRIRKDFQGKDRFVSARMPG